MLDGVAGFGNAPCKLQAAEERGLERLSRTGKTAGEGDSGAPFFFMPIFAGLVEY